MERLTIPLFALLGALPFYIPQLWFLDFFAFLPLFVRKDLKAHIWFGFVYGFLLYAFLIKAVALTTNSIFLTIPSFLGIVLFYALLQFGLPWLLTRFGVFYPLAFTLVEVLRLFFPFDGFPYEYLGKVLVNAPLLGLSIHYLTVFGATFLILSFNWSVYKLIEHWETDRKRFFLAEVGFITALLVPAVVYKLQIHYPFYGLKVALVQPFIGQRDKMTNPDFVKLYTAYLLTFVPKNVDLVLLPETSIPVGATHDFIRAFSNYNLLFGAEYVYFDFQRLNLVAKNLVVLAEKGRIRGIYAKEILVPFGEYTPKGFKWLERFIPYLANIEYEPDGFNKIFDFKGLKILPKVCNEVFYPMGELKNIDLVVVVSNDAWFGFNFPQRHLWEVKLRAIETGKVFIFVNNNGYSGIVYPDGSYVGFPTAKVQVLSL